MDNMYRIFVCGLLYNKKTYLEIYCNGGFYEFRG